MSEHHSSDGRTHRSGPGRAHLPVPEHELRFAAALAHSVPGVTLEAACSGGGTLTVAYHRPDAQLDPCQFRTAVLEAHRVGLPRLVDAVVAVTVRGGPEHLGGGVYRRCDDQGEQRWFLTELDHADVVELLAACPIEGSHEAVTALTRPDPYLGITAVRLEAVHPGDEPQLDRVAWWAVGEAMVAELIAASRREACR